MSLVKKIPYGPLLVALFGLTYTAMALVPVRYWYDVGEIAVLDGAAGQPAEILYYGGAVRQFRGSYSVIIRQFGSRTIACEATSSPFTYDPEASRPIPLTMGWWAPSDPRCSALPPGTYMMETCWTVHSPFYGLVPSKTACVASLDFTMR